MEMLGWDLGPATPEPQLWCLSYPLTSAVARVAGDPLGSSPQCWAPCSHTLPLLFFFIIIFTFLFPVKVPTEPAQTFALSECYSGVCYIKMWWEVMKRMLALQLCVASFPALFKIHPSLKNGTHSLKWQQPVLCSSVSLFCSRSTLQQKQFS